MGHRCRQLSRLLSYRKQIMSGEIQERLGEEKAIASPQNDD